jgi:hypothetical protein
MPVAVFHVMRPTATVTTATTAARMGVTTAILGVRQQQHGLVCGDDDAGHYGHDGGCWRWG